MSVISVASNIFVGGKMLLHVSSPLMIVAPTSGSSDGSLLLRYDQYSGESAICYGDYVTTARVVCYCLLVSMSQLRDRFATSLPAQLGTQ